MSATTLLSTFDTALATFGELSCTFKVQTALSATALVFACPVTVMALPAREAKPLPTRLNPYPTPTASTSAAPMSAKVRLREVPASLIVISKYYRLITTAPSEASLIPRR